MLKAWEAIDPKQKIVGAQTYPDCVILCCLTLQMQYPGFVASLRSLLGKGHWAIPDYTTLCRRQGSLPVTLTRRWQQGENIDIAIDSTGLKVYGEGEWKVRKHGASKRRTWRKLHIGIDVSTQEIISVELTTNAEDEGSVAVQMVKGKTDKLKSFRGDSAYDDFKVREALEEEVVQIARKTENEATEVKIKCAMLNKYRSKGMPVSYKIA